MTVLAGNISSVHLRSIHVDVDGAADARLEIKRSSNDHVFMPAVIKMYIELRYSGGVFNYFKLF